MTLLTSKERQVLEVFALGLEYENAQDNINDNMSYTNADDIQKELNWSKQSVGGVMSSLDQKGMIVDTMDSAREAICNDWVLTPDGIEEFYANTVAISIF